MPHINTWTSGRFTSTFTANTHSRLSLIYIDIFAAKTSADQHRPVMSFYGSFPFDALLLEACQPYYRCAHAACCLVLAQIVGAVR